MNMKELMKNKKLVLSWFEEEESRFIFEKRCEFSEILGDKLKKNEHGSYIINDGYDQINAIVERSVPQYSQLKKFFDLINNKKIWIWGAGAKMNSIQIHIKLAPNVEICGIIDTSEKKRNTTVDFGGKSVRVFSPDEVDFNSAEYVVISLKNSKIINDIINRLEEYCVKSEKIIVFQDYGGEDLLSNIYFEDFIHYQDDEVFVDVGVFDLDTTLNFIKECEKNNVHNVKSLAFEPDPISYKNCLEIKNNNPDYNIELINAALYSENTTLHFNSYGSECSTVSENNEGIVVNAVTLDSYCNDKITYIKMDIEGAELEALKGCKNTIIKNKPKLAISIYHKSEDIIEIPMYIKSLVPEYKLYLRHYNFGCTGTVLYAIP